MTVKCQTDGVVLVELPGSAVAHLASRSNLMSSYCGADLARGFAVGESKRRLCRLCGHNAGRSVEIEHTPEE